MRMISYLAIAGGAGIVAFVGCSSSDTTTPVPTTTATVTVASSAGAGGTPGASVTSSSTSTVVGSGGSGGMDCTQILPEGDCDTCGEAKCCAPVATCALDSDCNDCLTGQGSNCSANTLYTAVTTCITTNCDTQCKPPNDCNPITNAGCPSDGSGCDVAAYLTYTFFTCYPPPNDATLCGKCDDSNPNGPFCGPGLTCEASASNTCSRYCCADSDCGGGKCDMTVFPGTGVGACLGGGDAGAMNPSCGAPAVSPSNGSCVTFTSDVGGGGGGGPGPATSSTGAGGKSGTGGAGAGGKAGTGGASGKGGESGTGGKGGESGKGGAGGK